MGKYQPTVGLEIHAELKTKTKMFCRSANDPDETRPNVNVCPVCLAHPGTLPTINRQAVAHVLRMGLAVGGQLAKTTNFDRKNYFYPDLPKGYQISQYKCPLVSGGSLNGVVLTRLHLEEDTARSIHINDESLIDFNRAGVPLMELVTEPVIHSAQEASNFAREFQLLLCYLDVSEANMEKGEMRVEANVSILKADLKTQDSKRFDLKTQDPRSNLELGTKVEVKNLNSFRAVERAIDYEIKRQIAVLEAGEKVIQETRGWNEDKGETFSQRQKESAHDYRYFPDPDLPSLKISEISEFAHLAETIPELPWQKRARYLKNYLFKPEEVEQYVSDLNLGKFFETVIGFLAGDQTLIKLASNYASNDLASHPKLPSPENFADLIKMIQAGEVSSRGAKDVLALMINDARSPEVIATEKGLIQKNDPGELEKIADKIIADNSKVVADFKAGKQAALQFLIGQGMKASRGSANPKLLEDLFKNKC